MTNIEERFWSKVAVGAPDDCWLWTAAFVRTGYGSFGVSLDGKWVQRGAHRVAFFLTRGRWPEVCRHDCDTPACVNPRHLRDGSVRDNALDMVSRGRSPGAEQTHCKRDHEFTEANTYRDTRGRRRCRRCIRDRERAAYAAARAA